MQIGHIYQYANRKADAGSTFVLLKIDELKGQKVASIAIAGLSIKSKKSPDGISKEIGHFPISVESLLASKPIDTGKAQKVAWPNEGYDEWMKAVNAEEAGFWTKPLGECIDVMESILNK